MTYFTSDQHFGHENIIRFCQRPFKGAAEMNEVLVEKWNAKVGAGDEVWVLGDLLFRSATVEPILERLKGRKHLIFGNHDHSWIKKVDLKKYFVSTHTIYSGTIDGRLVTMCHYPMLCWPQARSSYMIYGHIHNNFRDDYWPLIMKRSRMLNAGVEVNNYEPVTFDELVANNKKFRDDYAASGLADTTEFFCAEA